MADRLTRLRRAARKSLIIGVNSHECICETLRTTYDLIHDLGDVELKEAIIEKLIDAFVMAKKMQDRLLYYKETYKDESGGFEYKLIPGTSLKRKMRKARIV